MARNLFLPPVRAACLSASVCLVLFFASGAASAQTAPDAAAGAATPAQNSIKLTQVILALPTGTAWLSVGTNPLNCSAPIVQTWTAGRTPQDLPPYADAFKKALEQAGYKVVTPNDNVFSEEANSGSADYEAAAIITDELVHGCRSGGGIFGGGNPGDISGTATMWIEWQIFSPVKKEIVARVATSGQAQVGRAEPGALAKLIVDSFSTNVRTLAANPDFQAAMKAPKAFTKGFVLPGQQDPIALSGSLKAKGRRIADAVGSVVTLLTGDGSGSGVLVSDDGYILTNAHVVGDEKTIRVRWSDRLETVAQVVRVSKDRDVALVKTAGRDRTPLPIKRGPVTLGEKVYAIGSPKGPTFQGTVSSGVVSADRILNGLRYVQSDVTVSFGSSGGALLNEKGELIGLTDLGVQNAGQPAGLNLFIPIGDALDFLSLEPK